MEERNAGWIVTSFTCSAPSQTSLLSRSPAINCAPVRTPIYNLSRFRLWLSVELDAVEELFLRLFLLQSIFHCRKPCRKAVCIRRKLSINIIGQGLVVCVDGQVAVVNHFQASCCLFI